LTIVSSSSDSGEKPYDSCELYARTKHTVHSPANHHSDTSSDSSPSQFLDCEAEEVWQSDEGCGSDDMQDFIVDDVVEEWGSCDASEVDSNKINAAHSVLPKCCHGCRLLDSSSESEEDTKGVYDL